MGKQSTGKSYYLNHLTGSSFAISGARCTDGVWLTVRLMGNCLLVVLDFEGLGSIERSAQEDTFLSVLNAAVSRLTVFRIEMRFDKDIDAMFSKFQQGVSLLKGDPRLFQGKLYLNAKDVNPNDQDSVVFEFQSKLEVILRENCAKNFVTAMYGGDVDITCCPPLGNVDYYEALQEGLELLKMSRDAVSYSSGNDFYDCLSMVLSKISLLDSTSMEGKMKLALAVELRMQIRMGLRYGKLVDCELVDGEQEEHLEKWKKFFDDMDTMADMPEDAMLDFQLDLDLKSAELLQESKRILMDFFMTFLQMWGELRNRSNEAQFDSVWSFLLVTNTFIGKRSTFEFTRQEMNGSKRKCSSVVAASETSHPDRHRCNSVVHYCKERCPCCQYFCDKAYGHDGLHRTSHGNMKNTYFVSDSQEVDVGERKYTAGEQGVAEMCPFFCSKMGRGHIHFMPCQHKADPCIYTASDGRKHCKLKLKPNPTMPMDEVLHATYWNTLGWEDPSVQRG
ncbi:unnamed protein product [Aphanomyces euteiches]